MTIQTKNEHLNKTKQAYQQPHHLPPQTTKSIQLKGTHYTVHKINQPVNTKKAK